MRIFIHNISSGGHNGKVRRTFGRGKLFGREGGGEDTLAVGLQIGLGEEDFWQRAYGRT